MGKNTDTQR